MPSDTLQADAFLNRESELDYLKGLAALKANSLGGNVFLAGGRGIGKTELLRQLHNSLFRQEGIVPFYYSFKAANLKSTYFARDYFSGFIKQYVAFIKRDPLLAGSGAESLPKLLPLVFSLRLPWLLEAVEDFQNQVRENDFYGQMAAAVTLPSLAATRGGKPVLVMLDDFDAAQNMYEATPGDRSGLATLFSEALANRLCPHVITGVTGVLEVIFRDPAMMAMMEQMILGPLPEDLAVKLFEFHLANLQITRPPGMKFKSLERLRGNPLYLRNLAKRIWKMRKGNPEENDLLEAYSFEVTQGDTAFYLSSVLGRYAGGTAERNSLIKLLNFLLDGGWAKSGGGVHLALGLSEVETKALIESIEPAGFIGNEDPVFKDFIRGLYLKEIEGRGLEEIRETIESTCFQRKEETSFELVIPMSANAELVVAKAVEQIGKNVNLNAEFLNYLQLALIEVVINAIEHSGSYDKKVFLKFKLREDRLEVIVENTGRPFSLEQKKDMTIEEKMQKGIKRGWGFKLVYSIMDDVKIERAGDRTRVIMTKNIEEHMLERVLG